MLGKDNKLVKEIRAINTGKIKDKFIIEGETFVKEIPSDIHISAIVVSENFENIDNFCHYDNFYMVSEQLFNNLSQTTTPQGVFAICGKIIHNTKVFANNFVLILDNIQDPGNMGTILRTAVCFGVNVIYASKGCVDIYNSKVLRSAAGAVFKTPIIENIDTEQTIKELQKKDIKVIATSPHAKKYYFDIDMKPNIAIIMGNESKGIPQNIQDICDIQTKIPIKNIESLNVSVACGIILQEVFKQKLY